MMLYSSNRNTLKKGRAATVLEQVDSVGSDEDKDSDISDNLSNLNFKSIVDHYNKGEIGAEVQEVTQVTEINKHIVKSQRNIEKVLAQGINKNFISADYKFSLNLTPKQFKIKTKTMPMNMTTPKAKNERSNSYSNTETPIQDSEKSTNNPNETEM